MAKKIKKITKIEPVSKPYESERISIQRVCAYCRVSTGSAEQKNSFDVQVAYYTKLIGSKEGWVCVGIYADEARSGTKTDRRDDFQRMVQDCRDGKIDLIMTKSVTRFARNTVDSIRTIRELKALGVGVYFEKEGINTLESSGELLITILSSQAQEESRNISENCHWGIVRQFENGVVRVNCKKFLGYTKDKDGNLVIVPEEAELVRRIFRLFLEGNSSYRIKEALEADGIRTVTAFADTDGKNPA